MSTGKYVSLEEAKDEKGLKRFIRQHPSVGDRQLFDKTLTKMAKGKKKSK